AQFLQIGGSNVQSLSRSFGFGGIAPKDGGAALRRNHRVDGVFKNIDAISDGYAERAARAAFSSHSDNYGNGQPSHLAKIAGDRLGLSALFGIDPGISARRIDENENRAVEFRR